MAIETNGINQNPSEAPIKLKDAAFGGKISTEWENYYKHEFAPAVAIYGRKTDDSAEFEVKRASFAYFRLNPEITSKLNHLLSEPVIEKDGKTLNRLEAIISGEFDKLDPLVFIAGKNCYECRPSIVRGIEGENVLKAEIQEATREQIIEAYIKEKEEKEKAEKRIERLAKSADFFVHELRGPLTIIKGNTQYMTRPMKKYLSGERKDAMNGDQIEVMNQMAEIVIDMSNKMDQQITDVISYFRASEQKPIIMDPSTLIEIIEADCGDLAVEKEVEIKLEIPENLPTVCVEKKIFTLIQNTIVLNAIQAGAKNITLSARLEGNNILFSVKDDGCGMDEKQLKDCFYTAKSSKGGTGMMLVISREIIEEDFKGTIMVESELGKGTTFTTSIPVHKAEKQEEVVFND